MERLQIFISGTQDDLQPERQAVAETIHALGHVPLMAETFGTPPVPSRDAIGEMIARADIYLGVYGARYGWKMEHGVSVTEFEFTEFRRTRPSRILIYVKKCTPEPEQDAFLKRVQDFYTGYFRRPLFTDATQLAQWVKDDLAQFIARVVRDKLRGAPDPMLIQEYLAQVAANKPYVLWSDQTYIDRTVGAKDFCPNGRKIFAPTGKRFLPQPYGRTIFAPTGERFSPLPSSPSNADQFPRGTSKTIGSVVRGFKIGVTKWFRQNTTIYTVWQRNYYEHIIRNDHTLDNIRAYIQSNPQHWTTDAENPSRQRIV